MQQLEDAAQRRTALPLPDVNAMQLAMFDAGALRRPVSATQVANVLWHREHGHSDVVRVGQMLGMLASVGMVVRHLNAKLDALHMARRSLAQAPGYEAARKRQPPRPTATALSASPTGLTATGETLRLTAHGERP